MTKLILLDIIHVLDLALAAIVAFQDGFYP
jgi:hypothetical protein